MVWYVLYSLVYLLGRVGLVDLTWFALMEVVLIIKIVFTFYVVFLFDVVFIRKDFPNRDKKLHLI